MEDLEREFWRRKGFVFGWVLMGSLDLRVCYSSIRRAFGLGLWQKSVLVL